MSQLLFSNPLTSALLGGRPPLAGVLGLYVSVVALTAHLQRWQSTFSVRLEHDFVVELRRRLFESLLRADWLFFCRSRGSVLAHTLTEEIDRVRSAAGQQLTLISAGLGAVVYVLIALYLSVPLTILAVACGAVVLAAQYRWMRRSHAIGERLSDATSRLYGVILDHLGGMKAIRNVEGVGSLG